MGRQGRGPYRFWVAFHVTGSKQPTICGPPGGDALGFLYPGYRANLVGDLRCDCLPRFHDEGFEGRQEGEDDRGVSDPTCCYSCSDRTYRLLRPCSQSPLPGQRGSIARCGAKWSPSERMPRKRVLRRMRRPSSWVVLRSRGPAASWSNALQTHSFFSDHGFAYCAGNPTPDEFTDMEHLTGRWWTYRVRSDFLD